MKRTIAAIGLLLMTCYCSYAQDSQKYNELYESKIVSYTKLKHTGVILGVCGAVAVLSGSIMVSNADWETTTNTYGSGSQTTTTDPQGVLGMVSIMVGVPMAVTGIVLSTIGKNKVKFYKGKLDKVSFKYDIRPNSGGFSLAYRF